MGRGVDWKFLGVVGRVWIGYFWGSWVGCGLDISGGRGKGVDWTFLGVMGMVWIGNGCGHLWDYVVCVCVCMCICTPV